MSEVTPLRIVQLTVENVKRIKAVSITPTGDLVVLSGRNAQGKTSVLDAIWLALGGGAAKRGTSVTDPIRDGETEARSVVDLGDLLITRTWTEAEGGEVSTKLTVSSSGGVLSSPQAVLDALIGNAGFDPVRFTQIGAAEQLRVLSDLVDLPFDPVEFDQETEAIFNKRTDVNRDVGKLKAQVEGMPRYPNAPAEPLVVSELLSKIDEAAVFDNKEAQIAASIRSDMDLLDALEAETRLLKERLEDARRRHKDAEGTLAAHRIDLAEWLKKDRPDTDDLRNKIETASNINEQIEANKRYQFQRDELTRITAEADGLTAQIDDRRRQKKETLAAAKFPNPALGFEDGVVTLNGLPFSQASAAEQLDASADIAMAGSARLKVITIRDGSLLDSEHLGIIERKAAERGYQVWIEKVDESGTVGVVIEDGRIAESVKS